jgi:hypothetical protein
MCGVRKRQGAVIRAVSITLGIGAVTIILSSETRNSHVATSSLQISDIYGLQQALNIRPVMGTGYNVSAAAAIDATGAMAAVTGDPTDCVLVDGESSPCSSSSPVPVNIVDGEVPMGVVNGVNASFNLANVPSPPASVHVYRNGLRLALGNDYTLSGGTLSFIGLQIPISGDTVVADYRY